MKFSYLLNVINISLKHFCQNCQKMKLSVVKLTSAVTFKKLFTILSSHYKNCQKMLSKPKYMLTKQHIMIISKFYCSDKTKYVEKVQLKKSNTSALQTETAEVIPENYDQCLKFEEKVLKNLVIEKEKEANLQSRLAKECRTLFNAPLDKSNFKKYGSIHLDQISFNEDIICKNWETYNFTRLEKKLALDRSETVGINIPKDDQVENVNNGDYGKGGINLRNRPVRQEPGKVIACFIPAEWWNIFFQKTGATGFGTFLFTFITFLVSKEIYVLEHYYYHGLGAFFVWVGFIKYIGPPLAKYLDKQIDEIETAWNEERVDKKKSLEEGVIDELYLQFQMEGQQMLSDVKRENVHLQREEEFRKRQMYVYNETVKRLNYQVEVVRAYQRFKHRNLVEYVTKEVVKAITPDMQDRLIYYSIDRIIEDLNKDKK